VSRDSSEPEAVVTAPAGDRSGGWARAATRPGALETAAAASLSAAAVTTGLTMDVLIACLGVAAVTPALVRFDLTERRLPNDLVAVTACAWSLTMVLHLVAGDVEAATRSLFVGLIVAVGGVAAAVTGGLGMGDVKLGAVLAAIVVLWGDIALFGFAGVAGACGVVVAVAGSVRAPLRRPRSPRPGRVTVVEPAPLSPAARGADLSSARQGIAFGPCLLLAFWAVVLTRGLVTGSGIVYGAS